MRSIEGKKAVALLFVAVGLTVVVASYLPTATVVQEIPSEEKAVVKIEQGQNAPVAAKQLYDISCLKQRLGRCEGAAACLTGLPPETANRLSQAHRYLDNAAAEVMQSGVNEDSTKDCEKGIQVLEMIERDLKEHGTEVDRYDEYRFQS